MTWPFRAVLGEAWRGRWRVWVWTGVPFAVLIGGLVLLELSSATALDQAERTRRAAGGDIVVATFEPAWPDASVCLKVTHWPAVRRVAAVGVPSEDRVGFSIAPGASAEFIEASPGIVALLSAGRQQDQPTWALGESLADQLGVAAGELVALEQAPPRLPSTPVVVQTIVDVAAPFETFGRTVIGTVARPAPVQRCIVEVEPGTVRPVVAALQTAGIFRGSGAELQLMGEPYAQAAADTYAARASRHGWIAVALFTSLFFWANAWFSRSRWGLYRGLGMSVTDLMTMATWQLATIVIPLAVVAWAGGCLLIDVELVSRAAVRDDLQRNIALSLAATIAAGPVGALPVMARPVHSLLAARL